MKGVSAVIAVILILMIVVALAALAYTWFTGIFSSLTQTAGTSIQTTTTAMAVQFRLEAASCNTGADTTCDAGTDTVSLTVRNTGTGSFNVNNTAVYIDGSYQAEPCTAGLISPGLTSTCSFTLPATSSVTCDSSVLAATIETGLRDSKIIEC